MKAYKIYSRRCNANSADGYDYWDDGETYYADSKNEAIELYLDDLTDGLSFDVRETHNNPFGNPVDYEIDTGAQFQIKADEVK